MHFPLLPSSTSCAINADSVVQRKKKMAGKNILINVAFSWNDTHCPTSLKEFCSEKSAVENQVRDIQITGYGATRGNDKATINAPSGPCILCNDRYNYCKWEGSPSPTAAAGFYFLVQGTLKSSSLFITQYCASSSSTRTKRPSAKSNSLSEQNWSVLQDTPETISLLTHGMVLSQVPWASDDFQICRISANLLWRSRKMAPIQLRLTLTDNVCRNDYYNIFKMLRLRTRLTSIQDRSIGNVNTVRGTWMWLVTCGCEWLSKYRLYLLSTAWTTWPIK